MLKELSEMIDRLDEGVKVPFMMHFNGYKYQEIADQMELPLGTIKSRIFFARRDLKAMINISYNGLADLRKRS